MTHVLLVPILLSLAMVLLVGQLMGPRRPHAVSTRVELRWVYGSGLVFGVLATWVFSPVYLGDTACGPDFFEYCQGILYLDGSHGTFPEKRSQFAGLLPWFLSTKLGILDGLALAGVLCTCVVGACLYGWARLLGGRAAGLAAVAFALAMAPMAALPRFLGFYPELCAGFCLAGTTTTAAILRPNRTRMALAGIGIGLCLLLDVRGLFWALPYLGGAGLAATLARESPRRRLEQAGALVFPVVISWFCGRLAYASDSTSLERQIDIRGVGQGNHGSTNESTEVLEYSSEFLWGWSSPLEIPSTLFYMWEQQALERIDSSPLHAPEAEMLAHHQAWGVLLGVAAVLILGMTIRRPRVLIGLFVSVLPFLVSYHSIGDMTELSARFYTHALPGIAVVAGVSAGLMMRAVPRWTHPGMPPTARGLLLIAVLLSMVMGWLPTWMSTSAEWRTPFTCTQKDLVNLPSYHGANPDNGRNLIECANAVYGDTASEELPLSIY